MGINPKHHGIINIDQKKLPFPAALTKQWNAENRNYRETDNIATIIKTLEAWSKDENIKSCAIDTINSYLTFKELGDRKKMSFDYGI